MLRGRSLLAYFSECAKVWSLPMVFRTASVFSEEFSSENGESGVLGCVASEEEVVFVSGIVAVFCAVGWRFGCWS